MKERRFLGALAVALFAVTGVANAACHIYGKSGLTAWQSPYNQCRLSSPTSFKCDLGLGGKAYVLFRDPQRNNAPCEVYVINAGYPLAGDRWVVHGAPASASHAARCSTRQVGSNTFEAFPTR
jgi:putative copper export protein